MEELAERDPDLELDGVQERCGWTSARLALIGVINLPGREMSTMSRAKTSVLGEPGSPVVVVVIFFLAASIRDLE